uniref:7TM_GPCR_Srx domain-containing protein n=1 Tax=Steinernema glaseri TaxID=37863 RepID=A0A1I8A3Y2_9BILA
MCERKLFDLWSIITRRSSYWLQVAGAKSEMANVVISISLVFYFDMELAHGLVIRAVRATFVAPVMSHVTKPFLRQVIT